MRLHPAVLASMADIPVATFAPPTLEEIQQTRVMGEADARAWNGPATSVAHVQDMVIAGVGVRVYDPDTAPTTMARPVVVYLHGGGWVFGSLDTVDEVCRRLADRGDVVVVSVDYRRAPEHPWPAAVDDVDAVLRALMVADSQQAGHNEVAQLAVDAHRVVVAGDSAGGFLAAGAVRRARDSHPVAGQVLVYPVMQREPLMGMAPEAGADQGLSAAEMLWYWDAFLGDLDPDSVAAEELDPGTADLTGLAPTLLVTAEHDILRGQGEDYAQALETVGVDVVTVRYDGMPHGFLRKFTVFTAAGVAVDQIAAWVRRLVG